MNPELSVSTASASSATTPAPSVGARRFSVDKRYLAPILVTLVLVAGQVTFGFLNVHAHINVELNPEIA
jgi:hypothetical protein